MSTLRVADGVTSWQEAGKVRTFTRDPSVWAFSSTSPWNLPIATTATFESATDPATADLIDPEASYFYVAEKADAAIPYQASYDDPVIQIVNRGGTGSGRLRSGAVHCPLDAVPKQYSDRVIQIIEPQRRFMHDLFHSEWSEDKTTIYTDNYHVVDLYGSGLGPWAGNRACGAASWAGILHPEEYDTSLPGYRGIGHPLGIAIPPSQMRYTGGGHGYDPNTGYGTALGYVWPATDLDGWALSLYQGNVPMGAYFAIPPNVDLSTIGVTTPAGMTVAQALQDYGGYVLDITGTSGSWNLCGAHGEFREQLMSNSRNDVKKIVAQLRIVTNNTPETPNGGTLAAPRRRPLAPPLPTLPEYR